MNASSSPLPFSPLFCHEVVVFVDSLTYFYEAFGHLITFMGVKFKLDKFLIIISEVLLFFLFHCFLH